MTTSTLHVPIVGGSPEERAALRQLLTMAGPGAFTAAETSCEDCAAAVAREPRPSCVLLAPHPPDEDGLRAVASLLAAADLPVVLLASADDEESAARALEHGAYDYLGKATLTHWRLALTLRRAVEAFGLRRQIVTDLAAQQAAAAQRRQAETLAQLSTLIAHAPIGIAFLDTDLRYRQVNRVLAALNRRTPAEHLGRQISEVIPLIGPKVEAICRHVLATGEPVLNHEHSDEPGPSPGVQRTWLSSFYPVRGPDGAILGVGALASEITERKLVERELERQHRQLEVILQTVQEAVVAFHADGTIAALNPAARRYIEIDDTVQPATWMKVVATAPFALTGDTQALDPNRLPIQRVLGGERYTNLELCHQYMGQPAERWISFSGAPVYDADGTLILGVLTAHEITQRKHAEAALREHSEALSRMNAQLARALRLKDEFLAMMSHELRTPLNAVLGITEALSEGLYGALNERQNKALATVGQSGRHLLAILADILDLTRIEAGKESLEPRIVDLKTICLCAIQVVQPTVRQKGLKLVYAIEAGITGLWADERRLTQILVNLLDNAVKFTPDGGSVDLQVTADATRETIQLTVSDSGIGIAAEDIDRLFQPFTQVDGGLSRQYGGIGLGLTLVRRLVELHGGSISLVSTPGQGSRFTISLRWSADDSSTPALALATSPAPWACPPSVVLADDHEATLALYTGMLARHGCQVTTARSGDEALAVVRAVRPDVAVLDLQMPGLDALTAIRLIRESHAGTALPIIALTALAMPGDQERCLATGASAYLAKPISLRTLLETIAAVLR